MEFSLSLHILEAFFKNTLISSSISIDFVFNKSVLENTSIKNFKMDIINNISKLKYIRTEIITQVIPLELHVF